MATVITGLVGTLVGFIVGFVLGYLNKSKITKAVAEAQKKIDDLQAKVPK